MFTSSPSPFCLCFQRNCSQVCNKSGWQPLNRIVSSNLYFPRKTDVEKDKPLTFIIWNRSSAKESAIRGSNFECDLQLQNATVLPPIDLGVSSTILMNNRRVMATVIFRRATRIPLQSSAQNHLVDECHSFTPLAYIREDYSNALCQESSRNYSSA
jgi:hypothetical protein